MKDTLAHELAHHLRAYTEYGIEFPYQDCKGKRHALWENKIYKAIS